MHSSKCVSTSGLSSVTFGASLLQTFKSVAFDQEER